MELTPRHIHDKQFHDAWRGYNQEEVDDFLDRVADVLDRVQRENSSLQSRIRELDEVVASSRETEDMLKKTLITAQRAAEEAIASAKEKAEQLIVDAEAKVKRATDEARERAATAEADLKKRSEVAEADLKKRSDAAEADLKRRTEVLEREHAAKKRDLDASIERLRSYEAELRQKLRSFLEQQTKALDALAGGSDQARASAKPAAGGTAQPTAARSQPQTKVHTGGQT